MDEYLTFAKDLALKAGDIMLEHFKPGIAREIKSDATPVTVADIAINKLVIEAVARAYPDHSVLGEEESSDAARTEYVWVCDPIDGTIPYTLGTPTSMFSLALVRNGKSILGVLYDPYLKRLYEATDTSPALMNGREIHVNDEVAPQGYIALPGMQYGVTDTPELVRDAISSGMRSFSLCCVTYEAAMVAGGQIAGGIFPNPTPWDIAAVKVIVEGAGGKVTDLHGNEQRYDQSINGAVFSNGRMHDQLVALAERHIA